jgi:hypothetical protein
MAGAWDKLGDEYASSNTVVIADVDCTNELSKELCQKIGVRGYPTIKYFTGETAATGDAYSGGRDYDALSAWAKENLGPSCGPENMDLCDHMQKAAIEAKQKLSGTQLDAEIEAVEAEIKDADATLKVLQSTYEEGKKTRDATVAAKNAYITLLRSVKRAKASDAETEPTKTEL